MALSDEPFSKKNFFKYFIDLFIGEKVGVGGGAEGERGPQADSAGLDPKTRAEVRSQPPCELGLRLRLGDQRQLHHLRPAFGPWPTPPKAEHRDTLKKKKLWSK